MLLDFIIKLKYLKFDCIRYFEFRLCPKPNAKQSCLDENVLHILGGSPAQPTPTDLDTRFYPRNGSRIYDIKARLPKMTATNVCFNCAMWPAIIGECATMVMVLLAVVHRRSSAPVPILP
ncbi:uncharacterized protein LOC111518739 isoform X2 [Drosophila willistoni]|uniref:uncharacterized protein LOC111518739 isoform X2 n=1 Tax=Drosophila willistoni TaxID=7260 RepID=UPI001F07A001|nr:uncharacterized protein LOC111518739 isoform X2 [Drosophila willistoni]